MVVDRHLRLVSVGLAVRRRSGDQRGHHYHSDLVVAPQNVDQEAVAFLSAGTFFFISFNEKTSQYSLYYSILQVSPDVADLDRILAVNHRGCLRREIGKEIEIGRETEKEIAIVTAIAIATGTASGIEIVTYCPDIGRQSGHLRGMSHIIFTIL